MIFGLVPSVNNCLKMINRDNFLTISEIQCGGTMQVADVAFSASTIGVSGNSRTGTRMTTPDGKQSFVVTSTKGVTINADQKKLLAITGNAGNDTLTKTGSADVMFKGDARSNAVNTRCTNATNICQNSVA